MSPEAQIFATACPLDCPDACSLEARVVDGQVVKLDGTRVNAYTDGYICTKVRRFPAHAYGPHRLRQPLLRTGEKGSGSFAPIAWDEALDRVAHGLAAARERFGGESILPFCYGGSNGVLTQGTFDARLFRRLGASQLARTVCAAPTASAAQGLYGKMPGVALTDYPVARLIVVWGANPHASGIHLVPVIARARENGARLAVVDPRRTSLAKQADLHLAPRPGTDLVLALAIVRWLFAEGRADLDFLAQWTTGWEELHRRAEPWTLARAAAVSEVPSASIESLARLYAESSPAVIRCGWGQERNRNGGSATAAILALPAVAGKFRLRGGGYTMSNSGAWSFDAARGVNEPEAATRVVNMNHLGRALTEYDAPPVAALFVYDSNALMTNPDQERVRRGLRREDLFTVVFDQVATDTARYADVVLPATTFLEHDDLARGYGAFVLQRVRPVVPPAGEARSNREVFLALTDRLGLSRPEDLRTDEEMAAALLDSTGRREELERGLAERGVAAPASGPSPVQFVDVQPRTVDGKAHLMPAELDHEAPGGLYNFRSDPATDRFPLALISPATGRTVSSTFGELHRELVPVGIAPEDARRRGLATGDRVRIWNEVGEVHTLARVDPDLLSGVAVLPKGLWSHHTLNGATACALAPDTLTDLGGGACFNDARVEIARLD